MRERESVREKERERGEVRKGVNKFGCDKDRSSIDEKRY